MSFILIAMFMGALIGFTAWATLPTPPPKLPPPPVQPLGLMPRKQRNNRFR